MIINIIILWLVIFHLYATCLSWLYNLFIFITPRPSKDDFWKPLTGTGGMENVTVMLIFFLFLSSVKLLTQDSCVGILYNYKDNRPTITISSSSAICRPTDRLGFAEAVSVTQQGELWAHAPTCVFVFRSSHSAYEFRKLFHLTRCGKSKGS